MTVFLLHIDSQRARKKLAQNKKMEKYTTEKIMRIKQENK